MAQPVPLHWRSMAVLAATLLAGGELSHASEPDPKATEQPARPDWAEPAWEAMSGGHWDQAVSHLKPGLRSMLAQEPIDEVATLEIEIALASSWSHLGLPDRAIEIFQRRFDRIQARRGPDATATFMAMAEMTERLQTYGDPAKAEAALVEALPRSEATLGTDHPASRRMRVYLARAQKDQRRFSEALTTLRPALEGIDADRHGLPLLVNSHITMAELLDYVGDESWREWLDRAVDTAKAKKGPDSFELARLYQAIVSKGLQKNRADYDALLPIAREAIRLRRRTSGLHHPKTVEVELQLVRLQIETNRADEARVTLERITARSESMGDVATVMLQKQLAELLFDEDDTEGALAVRQSIARQLPLLPREIVGVFGIVNDLSLSWVLLRLDRADEARPIVERSMAAINADLLQRLTQNGEAAFIHLIQQWDVALHLLMSTRSDSSFDQANWESMLIWRGLGPRILAHRAQQVRSDPDLWAIYKRRSALRRELADRVGQLHRSVDPGTQAVERAGDQRSEADRLEEEILRRLGPPPTPEALAPSIAELCATLDKHTTLVNFVTWTRLGDGTGGKLHYDAFILSGRDCTVSRVSLGRRKHIDTRVKRWRRLITAQGTPPEFVAEAGAEVAGDLLVPLMPYLERTKRLIVVPEDALALVAWGGLPHPDGGFLVERMDLATVQDVSELLRPPAVAAETGKTVLIGDVDYGDAPQLAANTSRSAQDEGEPLDRFGCLGGSFHALSGTASELDAVHKSVLGPVQRLQGSAATPDAVRTAIDGATHIHFATHGYFVDERCLDKNDGRADALLAGTPLARSGLALSGANDRPTAQGDGLLSAEELLDLDLSQTQLVVLSACDTGRGEVTTGQGVMGLRSALSLAGARNQVVSLWPIPDAETSLLMTDFYDALGPARPCRKCTVAGALSYAQRRALKRQRAAGQVDVRSWAAFEASGND